tara:strand:+ start:520 stop:1011 length:492 start_codon:yes stop_codon:yes gene_type:complete
MNYLKISLGILLVLAASRFIPHPPNFTSLIALSFYVPTFFGLAYLPSVILSFLITDLFIGMHNLSFFTWGSVFLIGLCSKYFLSTIYTRFLGVITGALIFFIITNFGVWITGGYGYTFSGLIECYFMAIPFFYNTIISTLIFSSIIEILYFCFKKSIKFKHSL